MSQQLVSSIKQVRFRKFAPIDRESPIIEILFGNENIMEVARGDGNDPAGCFDVAFYERIKDVRIVVEALEQITEEAVRLIRADESDRHE